MYDYFYGAEAEQFSFYRIPKVLFTEERFRSVSAEAKVLYGLLLDRMSLSCKNGWLDRAGRVYIIFTIDEVMTALGCADQKAGKLLHELESKCRLIERKRQGLGKPNLIYVKNFVDKAADNPVDNTSGSNAPYGYMKDPDDSKHWIPDREAADVVYEIGLYVMDGFGPSQIARKLRERKILTPAAYYESKGITCNVKKQGDPYDWDNTTIAHIMDRWREYLGHTVNFKTTKKSYKSKKKIKNPESEWVIFENTHEPIWTEAIAEAVKQARQSRRRPTKMGEMGMFSGMMYCADCGSILYQCRATGFRKDQEYYICSGYRKGKQVCGTPHSIRTVILEELILQNLREIVSFARSHENRFVQMVMDMDVKERNKGLAKKRKLLSESEKRITELDMIFKRLYEDNISGKLTDERFHKLSTDYEAEQAGLQAQAAILREEIEEVEGKSANVDRFLSVVRQYTDIPELTPRILHEFVEKIVIHAATDPHSKINRRQEVDIYYKGIGILEMSKVFDSRQK